MRELQRTNAYLEPKASKLKPLESPFLDMLNKMKGDKHTALLLDTSGSMHSSTFAGTTRINALRNIVMDLPSRLRRFAFSSDCREVTGNSIPEPAGSTELSNAFDHIKSADVRHAILITDGEPTDYPESTRRERILAACSGLRVDIYYVGGSDDPPQILKDIADQCGGKFDACDIELDRQQITSSIRALLEEKK